MLLVARRILSSSYCLGYFLPIKKEAETQAHEASQVSRLLDWHVINIPQEKISLFIYFCKNMKIFIVLCVHAHNTQVL